MKKIIVSLILVFVLTLTLVAAYDYDFCNYPESFVTDGEYNEDNLFVVGDSAPASDTLAIGDVITNLQYLDISWVDSDSITVEGGVTEQVLIGGILTNYFETEMQDDEIASLQDTEITFQGTDYRIYEELQLSELSPSIVSNLGTEDTSEVYIDVQNIGDISFYYFFEDSIDLTTTISSSPLTLDFSGYNFEITSIDSDTGFSAYVGKQYYLTVDESVTIDGIVVTLTDVSSSSAIVDVDGTTEIITTSIPEVVEGLQINVDAVYSRTEREDSSATLIIGEYVLQSFEDGDVFFSDDSGDLEWIWDIEDLTSTGTSQVFGFKSNFVHDDYTDTGVAQEGDCLSLPNEYLEICLDSLTSDGEYANVIIQGESTTVSSGTSTSVTPATALASEVSNPEDYNLFYFGRPCESDGTGTMGDVEFVGDLFGYSCDDWNTWTEGEGFIEVIENGDNFAVFVTGTSSDDVRRSARALSNYEDYGLCGSEILVTGTSLEDITVGSICVCSEEEVEVVECSDSEDCASDEACSNDGECITCVESDTGLDPSVKGTAEGVWLISGEYQSGEDYCDANDRNKVWEYYCKTGEGSDQSDDNTFLYTRATECDSDEGCYDGACIPRSWIWRALRGAPGDESSSSGLYWIFGGVVLLLVVGGLVLYFTRNKPKPKKKTRKRKK